MSAVVVNSLDDVSLLNIGAEVTFMEARVFVKIAFFSRYFILFYVFFYSLTRFSLEPG